MSPDIALLLFGVAALLATSLLGIGLGKGAVGRRLVYGIALVVCTAMSAIALTRLLDPAAKPSTAWLPLG
ncbi:MAG: hypothetical protein ACRES3_11020 [Steroidobacteraceae bacterium]